MASASSAQPTAASGAGGAWGDIAARWKPVTTGVGYSAGLVLIMLAVAIMFVLYVGTLGLTAYGVYWHLSEHVPQAATARSAQGIAGRWVVYLLPAIAGVMLVLVLLKPIFAPRARRGNPIVLDRYEEPQLHEFVENVCRAIGAPAPKVIHLDCDVNASAGFRSGILSMFRSGDLVLTIGMPLVAAMSKRQFAGVLAHEFGHFAQGAGMRSTYLAGTIVNSCLRIAFERDGLDVWLYQLRHAGDVRISLIAVVLQLMLWLTRLIIRGFALVGSMMCFLMLRRMEFDADRYEIQLAGSRDFASTFQKLAELNEAAPITMEECRRMYLKDKHVPNNFPALLADYSKRLPPETRDAIRESLARESAGLFSTHPSTRSRVAAAEAQNQPGLYTDDSSARQLFGDFTGACVKASYGHWRGILGASLEGATFIDTMPLLKMAAGGESRQDAVVQYLGFEPPTWRPFFPGLAKVPRVEDLRPLVDRLKKSRARIRELSESAGPQAAAFRAASEQRIRWELARAVMDAGLALNFKSLGLKSTSRAGVSQAIDRHSTEAIQAAGAVDELSDVAALRLRAALGVLGVVGIESIIDDAAERRAEADGLLAALGAMREVLPMVTTVRELVGVIGVASLGVKDDKSYEKAKAVVRPLSDRMRESLDAARRIAGAVRDPLARGEFDTNLGESLVGATPGWREIDDIISAGQTFVDRYADLSRRTLAELVHLAQRAEKALVQAARQQADR